jgi:hypothetical protein
MGFELEARDRSSSMGEARLSSHGGRRLSRDFRGSPCCLPHGRLQSPSQAQNLALMLKLGIPIHFSNLFFPNLAAQKPRTSIGAVWHRKSPDGQHRTYRWMDEEELQIAIEVHENTRVYFR